MLKRCLIARLQALRPHWVSSLGCGSHLFMTKPIACILPTDCHHDRKACEEIVEGIVISATPSGAGLGSEYKV